MKIRDVYLSAVLLVLIGVSIGTLLSYYAQERGLATLSEVSITEVNKSNAPYFDDEILATKDTRFLFNKIAGDVTPTVVYIEAIVPTEMIIPKDEIHKFDDGIFEKIVPQRTRTVGSGVIISENGYILTNHHVVEDALKDGLKVVLNDKREYPAKVVGFDNSTDLAVIKIDAGKLPFIVIGNSEKVKVGDWVLAIGNPFRLRSTVTAGIVSALSRDVQIINDRMRIESFIQTDAAINSGNSGGALVNTSGQLIGINTAIASQSGVYQGYGFAVPSNLALKVATDIIEFGEVHRAILGVQIASVDYDRAIELGMSEVKGVEILGLTEGSAADESGIQEGDIVLKVNGHEVSESNQLQEKVAAMRPGETVELTILRKGNELTKNVLLRLLQPAPPEEMYFAEEPVIKEENLNKEDSGLQMKEFDLGFRIKALAKPEDETRYDLIIDYVFKYTEAWSRGLRKNQKIISIDGQPVDDVDQLEKLLNKQQKNHSPVTLEILNEDNAKGYIILNYK